MRADELIELIYEVLAEVGDNQGIKAKLKVIKEEIYNHKVAFNIRESKRRYALSARGKERNKIGVQRFREKARNTSLSANNGI